MSMLSAVALASTLFVPMTVQPDFLTSPAVPEPVFGGTVGRRQWRVANSDKVSANTEFELYNIRREELHLNSRLGGRGIRVGWMPSGGGNWQFQRTNLGDHRIMKAEEYVAIYNMKLKKWMTRGHVNGDVFESNPSYEWILRDINGPDFAIYNTKTRGYLILLEGNPNGQLWHQR